MSYRHHRNREKSQLKPTDKLITYFAERLAK